MVEWNKIIGTNLDFSGFQPPQPNWFFLNEIGQDHHEENEFTDVYITRHMAKVSLLVNFSLTENQQIELFYGHLRLKIEKTVPRDTVVPSWDYSDALEPKDSFSCYGCGTLNTVEEMTPYFRHPVGMMRWNLNYRNWTFNRYDNRKLLLSLPLQQHQSDHYKK